MTTEVRSIVIEDHPLYRAAIVTLIEAMPSWSVIGSYGDAESALAARPDADIVVLDLGLPGMDGVAAIRALAAVLPQARVVVLTMSSEPALLTAALRAGALGYLVKGSEPEDISRALQSVARGQAVFDAQIAPVAVAQAGRRSAPARTGRLSSLTAREMEVLELVAEGRSNAEISQALFLSPKTARNHVSAVLTKLGVSHRAEAAALAHEVGLGRG